jgi:hypothetical protein
MHRRRLFALGALIVGAVAVLLTRRPNMSDPDQVGGVPNPPPSPSPTPTPTPTPAPREMGE